MSPEDLPFEPVFRSRPEPPVLVAIGLGALAIVVICTQLAYVVADRGPTMFGAQAQVQYQGATWVETQSERVNSRTLLEPVALAEGIPVAEFEANWHAGQLPGTQILQFEYHATNPGVALSVVDSVVGRYLAQAEASAAAPNPAVEAYETLENDLAGQLAEVEAAIARLEGAGVSPRLTALFQEKAAVRAAIDAVRLARINLEIFTQRALVPQLVTEPFVLNDPVGPRPVQRAVFGFLGGSILAMSLGFLALRAAANRRHQFPQRFTPLTLHSAGSIS